MMLNSSKKTNKFQNWLTDSQYTSRFYKILRIQTQFYNQKRQSNKYQKAIVFWSKSIYNPAIRQLTNVKTLFINGKNVVVHTLGCIRKYNIPYIYIFWCLNFFCYIFYLFVFFYVFFSTHSLLFLLLELCALSCRKIF